MRRSDKVGDGDGARIPNQGKVEAMRMSKSFLASNK
jgi:hypothetical protein